MDSFDSWHIADGFTDPFVFKFLLKATVYY